MNPLQRGSKMASSFLRKTLSSQQLPLMKSIASISKLSLPIQSNQIVRQYSILSQMEDHSTEKFKGLKEQQDKQKAIKVLLQRDMDSGRYKEKVVHLLEESNSISNDELSLVFKHLFKKKYYRSIMDLTDVLHLLNRIEVLKSSAELILKAASVEKNIRISTLMATLLAPDPFADSIYSTNTITSHKNPILEAQQISTLFAVKKLEKGKELLEKWPKSNFSNPIIISSLLSGLDDGGYYNEVITFYDWCTTHVNTSPIQASFRSTVTVTSLIHALLKTQQYEKVLKLFDESKKDQILLPKDIYIQITQMCDTSSLWRQQYKRMLKLPEYKDRSKRQQLQSQLYLEQLYKGVSILLECDKEYHVLTSFYNTETESFYLDGSKCSPLLIRMHLLLLLFSYPHLYSKITKGSVYVKMDRSEEKQQALEKLLSSDVYPPIHYAVEEQTTFFGGGDQKVSSINYSISIPSILNWSFKNQIQNKFPLL